MSGKSVSSISNGIGGSWQDLGLNSSVFSSIDQLEDASTNIKSQKVVGASSVFNSKNSSTDQVQYPCLPVDSVILARKRFGTTQNDRSLITDSPVDLEEKGTFSFPDTSDCSEKDFKDLYFREVEIISKDEKLELIIRGLLQDKFIDRDMAAIKRLPLEDRTYNVFRLMLNLNALKQEKFEFLYNVLGQVSLESKKTELRRFIQEKEANYKLA